MVLIDLTILSLILTSSFVRPIRVDLSNTNPSQYNQNDKLKFNDFINDSLVQIDNLS